MDDKQKILEIYKKRQGQLETASRSPLSSMEDLAIAYTPGVAEPCRAIADLPEKVWELTMRGRSIAIVTDGSAVLGLGNIGPEASLPVMEGKAVIYKKFGNLDAWPICLATQDVDEIVETVKRISPGFGAIHLEDISAPRCLEIEERLLDELNIPVLHDDQHATAIVILAGLINALLVTKKVMEEIRVTISGAGAAGLATAHLLADAGVLSIRVIDSRGVISPERREGMNIYKEKAAQRFFKLDGTDYGNTLHETLKGSDVFIGVSRPDLLVAKDIATMAPNPIVFALSNPNPEVRPEEAKKGGAAVIATGRSDYPNQVNNAAVYPGIFLGAMRSRVSRFTPEIKIAAATTVARLVSKPTADNILPTVFEPEIAETIAKAIEKLAE